jgi:16S rRNA (uracil1498-N3)-methyltransferase
MKNGLSCQETDGLLMNCILLEHTEIAGATAELRGRRARHVVDVLRATPGRVVRVGVLGGRLGRATVAAISADVVTLAPIELDAEPPPALPVTLCVALPRPKSLRRVLHASTTLGVKRIVLMETWRVDKSYWQSPLLAPDAIRDVLTLALEQAVDTLLPTVETRRRFRPFVEDEVPASIRGTQGLVAHPGSAASAPAATSEPITLFVGPDRGFTAFEIERLEAVGVRSCSLGPRVLRVDEAVPALLGRLLPR